MSERKRQFSSRRGRKGDDAWHHLETERQKRSNMEGIASVAAQGDREAALVMLRYAEHYLWEAEGIPVPVQNYLVECFTRAIQDESTEFAFNLKQKGGRGQKRNQHHREWRDSQIAKGVAYHRDKGLSLTDAVEEVANEPHPMQDKLGRLSEAAVKAAYLRFYPKEDN